MSRFIALMMTMFMMGAVQAAEIADAPIPEDNYIGILLFLGLMVGGGVWFFWKIISNSSKTKQEESK